MVSIIWCTLDNSALKDAKDCERKLRDALCGVSSKTGKKYNKVLIVIEGIYRLVSQL